MARSRTTAALTVDMSLVYEIIRRLRRAPRPDTFWRHLQALVADGCAIEMHDPMPGSGFDVRAVPSIQFARLLGEHGIFE